MRHVRLFQILRLLQQMPRDSRMYIAYRKGGEGGPRAFARVRLGCTLRAWGYARGKLGGTPAARLSRR